MKFLTLNVTDQDVNLLISALHEVPYKFAAPLITKLVAQAQEQLKPEQTEPMGDITVNKQGDEIPFPGDPARPGRMKVDRR